MQTKVRLSGYEGEWQTRRQTLDSRRLVQTTKALQRTNDRHKTVKITDEVLKTYSCGVLVTTEKIFKHPSISISTHLWYDNIWTVHVGLVRKAQNEIEPEKTNRWSVQSAIYHHGREVWKFEKQEPHWVLVMYVMEPLQTKAHHRFCWTIRWKGIADTLATFNKCTQWQSGTGTKYCTSTFVSTC